MTTTPHPDLTKVADLIKDVRVAFLHTVDSAVEGMPFRVRPMYTQRVDPETFDGTLWFFTDANTTKVSELQTNPNVLLTYADTDKNRYVVVKGTANCEHNPAKARELWNIHAKGWWPEGPESNSLMLIHVRIHSAEYWDGPSDTSYLLHLVKAVATGERIEVKSDHGRIGQP